MARYNYERLTALDTSFLTLETPNSYMHVASTMIFEAGHFATEDGGIDAAAIRRHIEAKLHLIPRYRQKLRWIPLYAHPVWVDEPRFNIDYHVRHTSLPRPGTEDQLRRLSGRVMQQHLDRNRPLWEMWIVEGLEGNRFAVISKVHHCMIDGASGVDIMRVLMEPAPEIPSDEVPTYLPRPIPSGAQLVRDEALRWASLPLRVVGGATTFVAEYRDLRRRVLTDARAVASALLPSLKRADDTPLNGDIGPHRRFDEVTMDLGTVKNVRRALGGSLNDIVLTIVTGAVRRFLRSRQVNPASLRFRVLAPVSVRARDEQGSLGNRVSGWLVELPLDEKEPRKQLARIHAMTRELKESRGALGAEILAGAAEWMPTTLLSLAGRQASRHMPFNLVVTNVPGPQWPMYFFGVKMLECFPFVPLAECQGLGIALMSYDGKLCWGLNGDYDLLPDVVRFGTFLRQAFEELCALALAESEPAANDAGDGEARAASRQAEENASPEQHNRSGANVAIKPAASG